MHVHNAFAGFKCKTFFSFISDSVCTVYAHDLDVTFENDSAPYNLTPFSNQTIQGEYRDMITEEPYYI